MASAFICLQILNINWAMFAPIWNPSLELALPWIRNPIWGWFGMSFSWKPRLHQLHPQFHDFSQIISKGMKHGQNIKHNKKKTTNIWKLLVLELGMPVIGLSDLGSPINSYSFICLLVGASSVSSNYPPSDIHKMDYHTYPSHCLNYYAWSIVT